MLRRTASLLVLALVPLAAGTLAGPADAQTSEDAYYRAYFLEHESGEVHAALELYRKVAGDKRLPPELAADARQAIRRLSEDLAASDLAALVPPETIVYAELNRPGEQLGSLLEQLGVLGEEGVVRTDRFAVSPLLLEGALGLRGAAVAITALDGDGEPKRGVAILHPGRFDLLRGLVDTALPAGGEPIQPIRGRPAWVVDDEMVVALSARLVVLGTDRNGVEGVLARLDGETTSSLAQSTSMRETLGGEALLGFYVQAEPIRPLLHHAAQEAMQHDPEAAKAFQLLDVESLESLSGRIAVEHDGVQVDLALQLVEGHRNLAFNLLRLPSVRRETLKLVPHGAAFFFAAALNRHTPVVPGLESESGEPIVTFMDFGREVFANVVDVTVFGLPPAEGQATGGLPDVACFVRANDVERSKALWTFVLGLASQSSSAGTMEPVHEAVAGLDAERYSINGTPVYLAALEHGVLVTPSRSALARVVRAHGGGRSVLEDEAFAKSLEGLTGDDTMVLVAHPGRCAALAQPLAPDGEADKLELLAGMLARTTFSLGVEHSQNRLSLHARIRDVPDVGRFVLQAAGKGGEPAREPTGAR